MLSPTNLPVTFRAFYTETKLGKTGLTVTVDVYRDSTLIVTAAAAVAVGGGAYRYVLAAASTIIPGLYTAVFHTATATVDFKDVADWCLVGLGQSAGLAAAAGLALGLPVLNAFGILIASTQVIGTSVQAGVGFFNQDFVVYTCARWMQTILQVGLDSSDWTLATFAIKNDPDTDEDATALLLVRVTNPAAAGTDGALTVLGAPASAGQRTKAGLTFTAPAGGPTTSAWSVDPTLMNLPPSPSGRPYRWEVNRYSTARGREVLGGGRLTVKQSVLRNPAPV